MKTHYLKTDEAAWSAVIRGEKTHEVRLNDRGFEVGDILVLQASISGAEQGVSVTYITKGGTGMEDKMSLQPWMSPDDAVEALEILQEYLLPDNLCVMSIKRIQ